MLTKAKIVKGGKISIPSLYRKALNIKEGDEIVFNLHNDELTLSPVKAKLKKVRDMINKYYPTNESLVDKLITERRAEAKDE
jgi:AbrB family looped-hinge helix DNA binding protein